MSWKSRFFFIAVLVTFAGCDDLLGPVDSEVIALTINSMNSSDIDPPGRIAKDENISHETGNPWGELMARAREECGRDPAGFEVLQVSIALDVGGSQDVNGLEDVIDGVATVYFSSTQGSDEDADRVDVGVVSNPVGTGPTALTVVATRSGLQLLHARLVGGDFHVGLEAETGLTDQDAFSMDVRVSLRARAHCE